MRKAIFNGINTQFVGWYMLANGWEVYLTEDFDEDGYAEALVLGAENEFGSIWFAEHKPYVLQSAFGEKFCSEVDAGNLAPPTNGKWLNDVEAA